MARRSTGPSQSTLPPVRISEGIEATGAVDVVEEVRATTATASIVRVTHRARGETPAARWQAIVSILDACLGIFAGDDGRPLPSLVHGVLVADTGETIDEWQLRAGDVERYLTDVWDRTDLERAVVETTENLTPDVASPA